MLYVLHKTHNTSCRGDEMHAETVLLLSAGLSWSLLSMMETSTAAEKSQMRLKILWTNFSVFPFLMSSNSNEGQQVPQQSPPTVEVTPPDSHPEGNGVREEQTEGDGMSKI